MTVLESDMRPKGKGGSLYCPFLLYRVSFTSICFAAATVSHGEAENGAVGRPPVIKPFGCRSSRCPLLHDPRQLIAMIARGRSGLLEGELPWGDRERRLVRCRTRSSPN